MATTITTTTINKTITVTVGNLSRTFIAHIPANTPVDAGVLIMYHGGGGTGANFQKEMTMDALADEHKFVTVYPTAIGGNWTDGRTATQSGPDDIAFTKQITWYLGNKYGTSKTKIFASGISNGGIFSHYLVHKAPNVVLAIAPVAANIPESYIANCINSKPIIMFNGTADPLMLFNGGIPTIVPGAIDSMASSYASIAKYAANCKAKSYVDTLLPDLVADGTTVTKREYIGGVCTPVTLYVINGGGHTWPGSLGTPPPIAGKVSKDITANTIMLDMFKKYGLFI